MDPPYVGSVVAAVTTISHGDSGFLHSTVASRFLLLPSLDGNSVFYCPTDHDIQNRPEEVGNLYYMSQFASECA